jgi:hypothetical protein
VVASSTAGAEVVAGSSGSTVVVVNTGAAVVASAAGIVVGSTAVSTGTVVNPKIVGVVASSTAGAEVVAGSSGSNAEVSNTGGAVVGCNGRLVVASITFSTGDVVIPRIVDGVDAISPHPSFLRLKMHAFCSGYHHAPPGLCSCATSTEHSSLCSSIMQHITSLVGCLH